MRYAELHCLSNFTFLRGASHPEELVEQASRLGYSALALTDECSLAGIVRAHTTAKDLDLKLIVGAEFTLSDGLRLVILASDQHLPTQCSQRRLLPESRGSRASHPGEPLSRALACGRSTRSGGGRMAEVPFRWPPVAGGGAPEERPRPKGAANRS